MKLTKKIINLSDKYKTPFLIFDLDSIKKKLKEIEKSIDGIEVFYAVKANDHERILEVLHKEGSSFEISSLPELKKLQKIGVSASKIICMNPIKDEEFLKEMEKFGIKIMAYDSKDEVDKIAKYTPSAELVVRVNVTNEGSDWPLTKKFGVDGPEVVPLLRYAVKRKLKPIGITFHVGSQCLNKNNWGSALYECEVLWKQAKRLGIEFNFLSLGGGLPIQHTKKTPSIKEIGGSINKIIQSNFGTKDGKLKLTIEPGRGLVGDSAIMVTKVVGKAKRGNEEWVYIDAGVFNALMETIQDFKYELKTKRDGRRKVVTIAGPSCDSVDIPFKNTLLPEVKTGDYVYIINTGAYTTVYAAAFNGFDTPSVYFIN